jgi:hypothetical protein
MSGGVILRFQLDNGSMDNGYDIGYGVANSGWQNPFIYNTRYAVLIGGGSTDSAENWPCFWNDVKLMYEILASEYNYIDENIYLHFWNSKKGDKDGIYVDGPADWYVYPAYQNEWGVGINNSFTQLKTKVTKNDLLYTFIVAHGRKTAEGKGQGAGAFDGYSVQSGESRPIYYANLLQDANMDREFDKMYYARLIVVVSSCGSGTALYGTDENPACNLSDENRILISDTDKNEMSFRWYGAWPDSSDDNDHQEFLWNEDNNGFIYALKNFGIISIKSAFDSGQTAALDDEWYTAQADISHAKLYEWASGRAATTYL